MKPFKCYGILWNGNYSFAKSFLKDINANYSIERLISLDISDVTYSFIKQIYPDLLPDEYARYKAGMLKEHGCDKIVVFCLTVPDPEFVYNPEELQDYCVQVKQLKNSLRQKYIPQIEGYERDILAHFADNENESKLVWEALQQNKSRITNVLDFEHPDKDSFTER